MRVEEDSGAVIDRADEAFALEDSGRYRTPVDEVVRRTLGCLLVVSIPLVAWLLWAQGA